MSKFKVGTRVLVTDDSLVQPWPGTIMRETALGKRYFGVHLDYGAQPKAREDMEFLGDWITHTREMMVLHE